MKTGMIQMRMVSAQQQKITMIIEVCNQIGIPYYAVNFENNTGIKYLRT